MKKFWYFIAIFFFNTFGLLAQLAEPKVIATSGKHASAGNIQVSYTVGEPVIKTALSGSAILTQGFHQTYKNGTIGIQKVKSGWGITIYPNPTFDFVHFKTNDEVNISRLQFFNVEGSLIKEVPHFPFSASHIDLSSFEAGIYLLRVSDDFGYEIGVYRIEKINK